MCGTFSVVGNVTLTCYCGDSTCSFGIIRRAGVVDSALTIGRGREHGQLSEEEGKAAATGQ